MTNRLTWIAVLSLLMASLLIAGNASAQAITTRSTAGTYSVTCDGYLTFPNPFPPAANPPTFQFAPASCGSGRPPQTSAVTLQELHK